MKKLAVVVCIAALIYIVCRAVSRQSNFSAHHPILSQVRENFSKLDPAYTNIPLLQGDSAYTENKETITLCLVNPDTNRYYDINTIMYVALHELAHVTSKTQGHGEEFRKKFSELLRRASELGIYNPNKKMPSTYCKVNTGSGH